MCLCLKKVTWREFFQCVPYKLKASFPWHIMRKKIKRNSLCFIRSHAKMDVFISKHEKRTFSLSQMNNAELAQTLSRRENALFEEREKNVFVKPNEQCRVCSNIVMARKRTFRGTRKERLTYSLIHLSSS